MHAAADPGASGSQSMTMVGEVIGNYRLVYKIGEGGMGEVYAAEHIRISRRVAAKLLRPEIVSNKEAVTRFEQEAESASSIGHKNIIKIEDLGTLKDGRVYMFMELLEGQPLNDMLEQPHPAERMLDVLIQTGHGLAAAHAKGIIHRDMKPENIFVTVGPGGEDIPKILDFGIAKVSGNDGQNNLTRTGTIFGTPFYMAPEQALGQGVDHRADIYAMGVIIYEVFSGTVPFQGESFMGILTQHITTEPEPVAQRAAKAGRQIPMGIEQVVARAMHKEPDKRYASMDELVNALVGIYRAMAGAGMSAYMEAHVPPGLASGEYSPAHPPSPTPQPYLGSGPSQVYGAQTPSNPSYTPAPPYPVAGDSMQFDTPAKKKTGLIFAILAMLVVGGGVAAFLLLSGDKSGDGTEQAGAGSGAATDPTVGVEPGAGSGAAAAAALDAGNAGATGDPSAVVVDAGTAVVEAAAEPDAAPIAARPVKVLVNAAPAGATIYLGKKKLGKSPQLVKVTPGESKELTVKRSGYKDQTVVVTGESDRLDIKLERKSSGGSSNNTNTGTGSGSGSGSTTVVRPHDPNDPADILE